MNILHKSVLTSVLLLASSSSFAHTETVEIVMKNHQFHPANLVIPANHKVKLVIKNQDNNAEEFESHALNIEKVIPANSEGFVYIKPMKPGKYKFVGEYHEDDMYGMIEVK
ncbi:cupredoxin domain-containing protein [Photobacterium andalusiense]|nr:cupredoxin domain-containing protein [Photobacterium andalusiense]